MNNVPLMLVARELIQIPDRCTGQAVSRLEQRFSNQEIQDMMQAVGLTPIQFRPGGRYWAGHTRGL